jgi:hypothetical protein
MDSIVMIHIPRFIKIGLGIQKLMGGGFTDRVGDRISLLSFFRKKEIRVTK